MAQRWGMNSQSGHFQLNHPSFTCFEWGPIRANNLEPHPNVGVRYQISALNSDLPKDSAVWRLISTSSTHMGSICPYSLSQFMSIPRYQGLCICGWGNAMQYFTVTDPSSAIKTFLLEDPLIRLRRNCRWCGRFRVLPFPSSSRVLCPGLTLLRCYRGFQEVWWLSRSVY